MSKQATSKQALLEKGYKEYRGPKLNVYFNRDMCQHAGRCIHGNGKVFNLEQKPWIRPEAGDTEDIKRIISSCPSGALQYIQ